MCVCICVQFQNGLKYKCTYSLWAAPYSKVLPKFTNLFVCLAHCLWPPPHTHHWNLPSERIPWAQQVKLVDKQGDLHRAVFCGPYRLVSITSSHLKSHTGKINKRDGDNNCSAFPQSFLTEHTNCLSTHHHFFKPWHQKQGEMKMKMGRRGQLKDVTTLGERMTSQMTDNRRCRSQYPKNKAPLIGVSLLLYTKWKTSNWHEDYWRVYDNLTTLNKYWRLWHHYIKALKFEMPQVRCTNMFNAAAYQALHTEQLRERQLRSGIVLTKISKWIRQVEQTASYI